MARRKRHTEEQIIGFLKEVDMGMKVVDVSRKQGSIDEKYYRRFLLPQEW